ncbi:MAG: SO_0444 family Cu/Zn efflux transporter [bacterium]|nr:SO_0444 family Cu/Zn efflux transporter [bacterium]
MMILFHEIWMMLLMASPYLLLGFLAAGLIHALIPSDKIVKMVGQDNTRSVFLGSLCGIPLPLCSCAVLPTAAALREKGASRGATTSFLISTPETGIDSIALTYGVMDLTMAILRPVAAFFTAFFAGIFVNWFGNDDKETFSSTKASPASGCCETKTAVAESCCASQPAPTSCCGESKAQPAQTTSCCSSAKPSNASRIKEALGYGFGNLPDSLAYWLALGFVLSGILSAFLPDAIFETWIGQGIPSLLLMLFISIPTYICASASTPIAAVLVAKGLSPGAAIVFLLAGPATNLSTIPVLIKLLGRKAMIIYLATIAGVSFLFGLAVNLIYSYSTLSPAMGIASTEMEHHGWFQSLCAMAMLALLVKGMWIRPMPKEFTSWLKWGKA